MVVDEPEALYTPPVNDSVELLCAVKTLVSCTSTLGLPPPVLKIDKVAPESVICRPPSNTMLPVDEIATKLPQPNDVVPLGPTSDTVPLEAEIEPPLPSNDEPDCMVNTPPLTVKRPPESSESTRGDANVVTPPASVTTLVEVTASVPDVPANETLDVPSTKKLVEPPAVITRLLVPVKEHVLVCAQWNKLPVSSVNIADPAAEKVPELTSELVPDSDVADVPVSDKLPAAATLITDDPLAITCRLLCAVTAPPVIDKVADESDAVPVPSSTTDPAPTVAVVDVSDRPDAPANETLDEPPSTDILDDADEIDTVDAVSTDNTPDEPALPTDRAPLGKLTCELTILSVPAVTCTEPPPWTVSGAMFEMVPMAPAVLTRNSPALHVTVIPLMTTLEPEPPLSRIPPLRLRMVDPASVMLVESRKRAEPGELMLMVLADESKPSVAELWKVVGVVLEKVAVEELMRLNAPEFQKLTAPANTPVEACSETVPPVTERVAPDPTLRDVAPDKALMAPDERTVVPPVSEIELPEPVVAVSVEVPAIDREPPDIWNEVPLDNSEMAELD